MPWFHVALKAGDPAPDFSLPDEDSVVRSLADFHGRWLVLFFYPKDHTPGCMREACRFGEWHPRFLELGAEVLGVSGDDAASHRRFRSACRLQYHLLSDPGRGARAAWGVPRFLGREGRSTFLVDPAGTVRFMCNDPWYLFSGPERAEEDPASVLAFLEKGAAR